MSKKLAKALKVGHILKSKDQNDVYASVKRYQVIRVAKAFGVEDNNITYIVHPFGWELEALESELIKRTSLVA